MTYLYAAAGLACLVSGFVFILPPVVVAGVGFLGLSGVSYALDNDV